MLTRIVTVLLLMFMATSSNANQEKPIQFMDSRVQFSLPDGWTLGEVAAIEKTDKGNFIVFHRGKHQLLEFDQNRNFVREIGQGLFESPHGLRIDRKGNIWTTDSKTHLVLRVAPSGEITMVLGKNRLAGTGWFDRDYNLTLFNNPLDVALDRFDNIYVVDKGNDRIVKLNSDGLFVRAWGQSGTAPGEFNFAHSIVIDEQDRIYVADRENKRIQLFDLDGKTLGQWTDIGYPYVLTLSGNSLWMTDARAEKIQQFNLKGELLASYQGHVGRNPGQFSSVHGIHVNTEGTVWVTQIFNWGGINKLERTH